MASPVADVVAFPEKADDLDRFFQPLLPNLRLRPPMTHDVLVEVLPRPHSEKESPRHHGGGRRRGLRHHGGMDADGRAGDRGAELQVSRHLRDATDDGRDKRPLSLLVHPGMVVVRDQREREAALLGHPGVPHEVRGLLLLAGELVAEPDGLVPPPLARRHVRERGARRMPLMGRENHVFFLSRRGTLGLRRALTTRKERLAKETIGDAGARTPRWRSRQGRHGN